MCGDDDCQHQLPKLTAPTSGLAPRLDCPSDLIAPQTLGHTQSGVTGSRHSVPVCLLLHRHNFHGAAFSDMAHILTWHTLHLIQMGPGGVYRASLQTIVYTSSSGTDFACSGTAFACSGGFPKLVTSKSGPASTLVYVQACVHMYWRVTFTHVSWFRDCLVVCVACGKLGAELSCMGRR